MQRPLNIQLNYISVQGGIRMAPENRAGLVQDINDALCNQICKGDLARRMHTDKLLLRLGMALKTLVFKLWRITKNLQEMKRADRPNLFKSEPVLAEIQTPVLSSQSTGALFMHRT